jgi:hypothetical protein
MLINGIETEVKPINLTDFNPLGCLTCSFVRRMAQETVNRHAPEPVTGSLDIEIKEVSKPGSHYHPVVLSGWYNEATMCANQGDFRVDSSLTNCLDCRGNTPVPDKPRLQISHDGLGRYSFCKG